MGQKHMGQQNQVKHMGQKIHIYLMRHYSTAVSGKSMWTFPFWLSNMMMFRSFLFIYITFRRLRNGSSAAVPKRPSLTHRLLPVQEALPSVYRNLLQADAMVTRPVWHHITQTRVTLTGTRIYKSVIKYFCIAKEALCTYDSHPGVRSGGMGRGLVNPFLPTNQNVSSTPLPWS